MRSAILGLLILAGGCAAPAAPSDRVTDIGGPGEAWGERGSASRGTVLAQAQCSGCHAVGNAGASPMAEAPPFRDLTQRYPVADLQEAFGEGLVTAHPSMPEFQFEPTDIADLIAYLEVVGETDVRTRP